MAAPRSKDETRRAIFVWDDTNKEYVAWDGVLNVNDLQIGAVEIKDGDSDTRLDVESDGTKNAAFIQANLLPLPTGAATETKQDNIISAVQALPNKQATATSTAVSVGATSTTVLEANVNRREAIIVNDSDEAIYLKFGSGATLNSGFRLNQNGGNIVVDSYTGIITGICASGSKVVTVIEI